MPRLLFHANKPEGTNIIALYPVVVYVLPFHIYLPDGIYDVVIAGKTHRIEIALLANQVTDYAPIEWEKIGFEPDHDIFGRTGNTEFAILVNEPVSEATFDAVMNHANINGDTQFMDEWEEKCRLLIDEAIKIGNRLLEVYRDQDLNHLNEPSFHIIPVTRKDVSNTRLLLRNEKTAENYRYLEPFSGELRLKTRSEDVVQTIRKFLKDETPIPVSRILTRQAEYFLWRGDYRLVPIEINTVFEMTVDMILDRYIESNPNHKKPELLRQKLRLIQKLSNSHRQSIGKPEIFWIAGKDWEALKKLKGVPEYRQEIINWLIDCYQLRNDSIHKGSFAVSKSEAETALESTKKAISFLQTLDDI